MITFKPVVAAHQRRADGTYNVKIRVTFKRKSRWLPTTITCTAADLTRSLHIKSPVILAKCDDLINRMREVASELSPFALEEREVDFVVRFIAGRLKEESWRLDFFGWAEQIIAAKSPHTAETYSVALSSFRTWLGKDAIDINDITHTLVQRWADWVDQQPKGSSKTRKAKSASCTARSYVSRLAHIHSQAKLRYNDEDEGITRISKSPFYNIATAPGKAEGQKNIGPELMQRIILARVPNPRQQVALDAFVLSFALMGANLADLYAAHAFRGDVWVYRRKKTQSRRQDHAEMRVDVPPCVAPVLRRMKAAGPGSWWLPGLHLFTTARQATQAVNRHLAAWCESEGVPRFTFYAARKTFASLARSMAGVDKATIDECLCHVGDFRMADIYIERDWRIINEASRRLLQQFEWPE